MEDSQCLTIMCAPLTSSPLPPPHLRPPSPIAPLLRFPPSLPPRPSNTSMPSVCPTNGFCRSWFSSFNKHYCQDNAALDEALAPGQRGNLSEKRRHKRARKRRTGREASFRPPSKKVCRVNIITEICLSDHLKGRPHESQAAAASRSTLFTGM